MSRTMHAIWHFIAVVPLLVYIAIDLKPFQDDLEPAEDVKVAAQVLFFVVIALTTIATVSAFRFYQNRNIKYKVQNDQAQPNTVLRFEPKFLIF